jgi:hypothetical protein
MEKYHYHLVYQMLIIYGTKMHMISYLIKMDNMIIVNINNILIFIVLTDTNFDTKYNFKYS